MTSPDERSALDALLSAHDHTALVVVTLASVGVAPDPYLVADVADVPMPDAAAAVERARGCGVLSDEGLLSDSARGALRVVMGEHGMLGVLRRLARVHLDSGGLGGDLAVSLADAGLRDPDLAQHLVDLASAADRLAARRLWDAAAAAGAQGTDISVPYADALLASGDLDTAALTVDAVLSAEAPSPDGVRGAVRVASTVALMRGTASHAADLYRWLGPDRIGPDAAYAVTTLLAVGDADCAATFVRAHGGLRPVPPTSANARSTLVARGLLDSLTEPATVATGSLLRAASMADTAVGARAEPEHPAVIAALIALHTGDPATARAVLTETIAADPGCAVSTRCRLLLAWSALVAGDTGVDPTSGVDPATLPQRDALSYFALRVATARRRGDTGALMSAWQEARRTVAEAEPDLFSLIPLGELWLAAVRLGDTARIAHSVSAATALVASLGEPPTWAATWHWYGVQAAILGGAPADLLPHARALGSFADRSPHAAALASAGKAWLRVLQGEPDVAEVETSARTLEKFGHAWDAARLASDAALRVADTRDATALLQIARDIGAVAATAEPTESGSASLGALTEREAEVAHHLVLGLTYREIGAQMYISAKTVEHHVARIRRRLGAQSRSQMLSMLRAAGYAQDKERRVHA
ncbi:helix-turn-helix transcriptional regulator [Rhodococcus sp. BP-241]|uniref:LuxR C-terminal-related transcriptional regulator n=1 Tax=Rhodococcus sp. BP-241 TaxID=2739441 RepID=UPI001C9A9AA2|nr:LuxR C-terminal-related transcriptional regulator [Rhodococcus sp. BP-241]MBY6708544.1 helix-turn-helix transcriptional regulator [Rhodococcus sp. BP-241]